MRLECHREIPVLWLKVANDGSVAWVLLARYVDRQRTKRTGQRGAAAHTQWRHSTASRRGRAGRSSPHLSQRRPESGGRFLSPPRSGPDEFLRAASSQHATRQRNRHRDDPRRAPGARPERTVMSLGTAAVFRQTSRRAHALHAIERRRHRLRAGTRFNHLRRGSGRRRLGRRGRTRQRYVMWHGVPSPAVEDETGRAVFVARSTDDGRTFARETPAISKPTGACGCCGMTAFADGAGNVFALYRAATERIHRDEILLASRNHGADFEIASTHPWKLSACPMSSASLSANQSNVLAAWETAGDVFFARVNAGTWKATEPVFPPGNAKRKHPVAVGNSRGEVLLAWTTAGKPAATWPGNCSTCAATRRARKEGPTAFRFGVWSPPCRGPTAGS